MEDDCQRYNKYLERIRRYLSSPDFQVERMLSSLLPSMIWIRTEEVPINKSNQLARVKNWLAFPACL